MDTFITPQLTIGVFAAYGAKASLTALSGEGYRDVSFQNLKYRYLHRAAKDVLEIVNSLGFVAPICSSDTILAPLLVPEQKADLSNEAAKQKASGDDGEKKPAAKKKPTKKKSARPSLVYQNAKTGYVTNIPALVNVLFFWISREKKLRPRLDIRVNTQKGIYVCDQTGNLPDSEDLNMKRLMQMLQIRVYHEDFGVERNIPEAIMSLITDGRYFQGKQDGITFANLISDIPFTAEQFVTRIGDFASEKHDGFSRRFWDPSDNDVKLNLQIMEEDEKLMVGDSSGQELSIAATGTQQPVSQDNEIFATSGQFNFKGAALKNLNADTLGPEISAHSERLLRLVLAKAASDRIDPSNANHTQFSSLFIQENEKKSTSNCIMNALSRDIIQFLLAICNFSLDAALEVSPDRSTFNPLDAMNEIRSGAIPIPMLRNMLADASKDMLGDGSASSAISASAAEEEGQLKASSNLDSNEAKHRLATIKSMEKEASKSFFRMQTARLFSSMAEDSDQQMAHEDLAAEVRERTTDPHFFEEQFEILFPKKVREPDDSGPQIADEDPNKKPAAVGCSQSDENENVMEQNADDDEPTIQEAKDKPAARQLITELDEHVGQKEKSETPAAPQVEPSRFENRRQSMANHSSDEEESVPEESPSPKGTSRTNTSRKRASEEEIMTPKKKPRGRPKKKK